jgi:hypothetical protein
LSKSWSSSGPLWFNTKGDFRYTGMTLGFTHDDGWFEIIWRLCADLEPLLAELEQETGLKFEILQVKEKFGGLRVHTNQANDAIRQRIEAAIQESFHTCEVCGQPGKLRENGLIIIRPCATSTRTNREHDKTAGLSTRGNFDMSATGSRTIMSLTGSSID